MAHQGAKFSNPEERRGYFIWLDNLEFEILKVPRPHKSFVLRVPAEIAQQLVDQKEKREYTDMKRDIHESDLNHLQKSVDVYDDLCELFPKDFERIDCIRGGELIDSKTIHKMIWEKIHPMLKPTNKVLQNEEQLLQKTDSGFEITKTGKNYLKRAVTNTEGNVYAFTEELSPMTVSAAMARLSRRGDDMRITLLDEFAATAGKDADLLKRVITAYGDDSVQQLVGQHVVVENASNLLTKKLEWGRLASYLEQSTRYIFFDQKNKAGKYRYYTPEHFNVKIKDTYNKKMDHIFDIYSEIVHKLTDYVRKNSNVPTSEQDGAWKGATRAQACDAVRPVLPVATTSTVGIYASGQALESLIMHLLADDVPEAQNVGQQLLDEARKVIPTFLERADKPDRGGATIAYWANTRKNVKALAEEVLPAHHSTEAEPVTLTSYWPKNELDLVPDMLYDQSNLPLNNIEDVVDSLGYEKRLEIFSAYMGERLNRRHRPGRALEKAHYSWDLVCDYGIFRDLQRHRIVDDLQWQLLTPRYGYEIPKLIEESGLTDLFEKCFDISLELYSELQSAGYELEAQYATLLGHRMRWKVTYNAREAFHLHELRTTPQGHPGYRKLVQQMHEKLSEVHPLLGQAMKFVNQGEDPELTRLAAEKYTQFKLKQLEQRD
jgi:thymidylate synthase ThyX